MPHSQHSPSGGWLVIELIREDQVTDLTQLVAHKGIDCVLFRPQTLMEFWTIALHITEVVKRA